MTDSCNATWKPTQSQIDELILPAYTDMAKKSVEYIAKFQCPGKEKATTIKNHLEIIALNGTISPHKCHLHISTSDEECKVWAGHLEEGTIILKSADLLIGFLEELVL